MQCYIGALPWQRIYDDECDTVEILCGKCTRTHFGSVSVCVPHFRMCDKRIQPKWKIATETSLKVTWKSAYCRFGRNSANSATMSVSVQHRIAILFAPVLTVPWHMSRTMENILQLSFHWWSCVITMTAAATKKTTTTTTTLPDTNKLKSGDRIHAIRAATLWDTMSINIRNALIVSSVFHGGCRCCYCWCLWPCCLDDITLLCVTRFILLSLAPYTNSTRNFVCISSICWMLHGILFFCATNLIDQLKFCRDASITAHPHVQHSHTHTVVTYRTCAADHKKIRFSIFDIRNSNV